MRECKTPGATYSFSPANNYQDDGWRLHVAVHYPIGKLGGINNDMFGSRSPHGLYRDIVHDAMEWATAEIQRLNAIYCERTDCLPRHPDYEAQRSAAVAEIEHERRPFPPDLGAQGEPVAWAQMLAALKSVNKLIAEASMTGFNCHDGDWAERLFFSQQATSAAIKAATAAPAAPRAGSGVSAEALIKAIHDNVSAVTAAGGESFVDYAQVQEVITALFAQAPRDGGETQGLDFVQCLRHAALGYDRWAAKPHNARWSRKIDGTPIRNDLCVNIAEQFMEALSPTPPSGVETIRQDNTSGGADV